MRLLVLFIYFAVVVFIADGTAVASKRIALVIGNNSYENLPENQQLVSAVNDARAVSATLDALGFEVMTGENLGRNEFEDKVFEFTSRIEAGDIAMFFYAGHGVNLGGGNYLLPSDIRPPQSTRKGEERRLIKRSIWEQEVISSMKEAGARVSIAVIDACRDNPLTTSNGRSLGGTRGLQQRIGSAVETRGTFSIYSAGYGQQALDRLPGEGSSVNSVFTRVFVNQLIKPGMTLRKLAVEVKGEVSDLVENVGFEQDPAYYDGIKGRNAIYFSSRGTQENRNTNQFEKDNQQLNQRKTDNIEITYWNSIKDSKEIAYYEAYLRAFPEGKFKNLANLQLKKLKAIEAEKENAAAPRLISIGTGGVTGTYYPIGGAICRVVNKGRSAHGVTCSPESTRGSIYNINTIRAGQFQFGVVLSYWQYEAYNGLSRFRDKGRFKKLRSVFSVHAEPVTMVAREDSGIRHILDLKRKRLNIGGRNSGARATWNELENALGWRRSDLRLATEYGFSASSSALCNDKVDSVFWLVGHPSGITQETLAACNARLVEITGPEIDRLIIEKPYYRKAIIPAGTYNNLEDIHTFGLGATIVTSADVPHNVVYMLVKSVFENFEAFKKLHPTFANLKPSEMVRDSLSAPLHSGAKAYYREKGWL